MTELNLTWMRWIQVSQWKGKNKLFKLSSLKKCFSKFITCGKYKILLHLVHLSFACWRPSPFYVFPSLKIESIDFTNFVQKGNTFLRRNRLQRRRKRRHISTSTGVFIRRKYSSHHVFFSFLSLWRIYYNADWKQVQFDRN